ncbi:hypothetical protein SAMN05216226_11329 [Halovenus aranensis]|uniref:Uncharacterized protein n=1 Tax=Halovenus aranensis TaxID=890420 RepID=A0A1G8Y1Y9_9EURY|nr:hypothetical protein [Halovenus aranensis]SDJ96707.1 hypothetical protein SAMN05216226_11329 [Halovenus aranensis]
MPESPRSQRNLTRRRFLATGASVATAALAGCNGLPGGSKTFETAVHENSGDELSWDFPTQSEAESVGYVEIGREPTFDTDDPIASRGFHFNASVDPTLRTSWNSSPGRSRRRPPTATTSPIW